MACIIIPAYNEEKMIGSVVRSLVAEGFTQIVVVNDGSTDTTATVAREAGARVISHAINRGQGAALQTGDEYARHRGEEQVVHFDADGQLSALDIKPALEKMRTENLDVILGSRFLDARSRLPWTKRYLLLPISRWVNYVFTGIKLTDAHNGFRILNRRALEALTITHDGMAHNSEIVAQLKSNGLRWGEQAVEVRYYEYGQGLWGGTRILVDLLMGYLFKK